MTPPRISPAAIISGSSSLNTGCPGDISLDEVADPEIQQPGDAIVRIRSFSISSANDFGMNRG